MIGLNLPCIHVNPNNESIPLRIAITKRSTWKALPFFNLDFSMNIGGNSEAFDILICWRIDNSTSNIFILEEIFNDAILVHWINLSNYQKHEKRERKSEKTRADDLFEIDGLKFHQKKQCSGIDGERWHYHHHHHERMILLCLKSKSITYEWFVEIKNCQSTTWLSPKLVMHNRLIILVWLMWDTVFVWIYIRMFLTKLYRVLREDRVNLNLVYIVLIDHSIELSSEKILSFFTL